MNKDNTPKAPKLRFKGFTGDWEQRKLGHFVERVSRKNDCLQTDRVLTIASQYGLIDQNEYFNKRIASANISNYTLLYKGEFAYNKSYSVGYPFGSVKRLDLYENGALSTLYITFAVNKNLISSDFLVRFYETNLWHKDVSNKVSEGARNHGLLNISSDNFFDTNISFPKNLKEQNLISSFFNGLDSTITLHQRKLETLKEIKKSLLQKIFNQEIRFKDDDGSEFPEWENYVFKDVFLNLKNNCFSRAELTDEIRTIRNVHYGDILIKFSSSFVDTSIEQLPYLMNDIPSLSELQKLQSGDVIFADTAEDYTAGKAIELQNIEGEIVSGLHTIPCRPIIEHYIGFFAYYLNSPAFHDQLIPLITGTKVMAINKGQLAKTFLQIPSIKEQTKITKLLSKFDKKIELAENKLAALKEMKKGLLQKMFI